MVAEDRTRILSSILSMFPRGHLVDLGAGHGVFSMLAHAEGWKVTAIDARADRWPADAPSDIVWRQQDVRNVDLEPYDLVLCLGLFYHLTFKDQLRLLKKATQPMVIDTHLDHGEHRHELSERVDIKGYAGRLYKEPGKVTITASFGNPRSFCA